MTFEVYSNIRAAKMSEKMNLAKSEQDEIPYDNKKYSDSIQL